MKCSLSIKTIFFCQKWMFQKINIMEFRNFRAVKLESIIDIKNSNKIFLMKKITIFLIAISFFGMLQAQETSQFTFNHVALSVKDVDKSAIFYNRIIKTKNPFLNNPMSIKRNLHRINVGLRKRRITVFVS